MPIWDKVHINEPNIKLLIFYHDKYFNDEWSATARTRWSQGRDQDIFSRFSILKICSLFQAAKSEIPKVNVSYFIQLERVKTVYEVNIKLNILMTTSYGSLLILLLTKIIHSYRFFISIVRYHYKAMQIITIKKNNRLPGMKMWSLWIIVVDLRNLTALLLLAL